MWFNYCCIVDSTVDALVSAPITFYWYFKPVSKSMPDPEGPLSKTLASATIKVANEAALATPKQPKVLRSDDA